MQNSPEDAINMTHYYYPLMSSCHFHRHSMSPPRHRWAMTLRYRAQLQAQATRNESSTSETKDL